MVTLRLSILFSIVFSLLFWKFAVPSAKAKTIAIGNLTVPLFFILALVLRIILSTKYIGFGSDIACFSAWADRMVELGPGKFYAKDYFSDYPPLYLYVLYVIGLIKKTFHLVSYSSIHVILLKAPSILADLGTGYLIYKVGTKRLGLIHGLCLSALYLFQPVVLMNSCLWGQVDSVYTFLLLLSFIFLENLNFLPAVLIFALDVLLKPQALMFAPVMLLGFINYIWRGSFSMRMLIRALAYGLLSLIISILLVTPFGMENVLSQYLDTVASYPYASVNAYNFWTAMGLNWYPQTTLFLGLPCTTWGFMAIILAVAFSIILGLRLGKLHGKYFVSGAFLIITIFMFSVRMHERYLYPMIPMLLLGFTGFASRQATANATPARDGSSKKGKPRQEFSFALRWGYPIAGTLLIVFNFCNTAHVLFYYDPSTYDSGSVILKIVGFGMLLSTLLFYYILLRLQSKKEMATTVYDTDIRTAQTAFRIEDKDTKMTRLDYLLMLFILVTYSSFALRDLGSLKGAQTIYDVTKGESMTFTFPEDRKAVSFSYYIAPKQDQLYLVSCDGGNSESEATSVVHKLDTVFCWKTQDLLSPAAEVSMTAQEKDCRIIELVFLDENKMPVLPTNASSYPALFDEQDLYPETFSYRTGTYFDEIYHARTAYEFLHGMYSYENTHPPFGKILISIGIAIFGMVPFGWRIIGTLIGIAMLPFTYSFAKKLTGDTAASALTCFIFAFDFMHFAQTRIATIDVYIVFFIICMYYFLYLYLRADFTITPLRKLLIPLALSGISMGFGVASKWTGVYAGMGMGLLFFLHLIHVFRKAKLFGSASGKKTSFADRLLSDPLGKKVLKLIGFCMIFFVVIPLIIYVLSYIPFRDGNNNGLIKRAIVNQNTMYSYHSKLEATHYFSSPFYQWPFMSKPIWYYSGVLSDTVREGISAFGNPLVWWLGIPAFFYVLYLAIRKKDRRALFLVISYLSQFVPWFFVTRLTFIYHYFPCVIFVALMIGYSFRSLKESLPKNVYVTVIALYALLTFGAFLLFYPVLAGQPVEIGFVTKYLRWFKDWIFVAS